MNRTICLIALTWASAVNAQAPSEIPLYPGAAPGSEKWDWEEKSVTRPNGLPIVTDVVKPVLIHYPAEKGNAVGSARGRPARMWPGSLVPVSAIMPTSRANRKTIWSGGLGRPRVLPTAWFAEGLLLGVPG